MSETSVFLLLTAAAIGLVWSLCVFNILLPSLNTLHPDDARSLNARMEKEILGEESGEGGQRRYPGTRKKQAILFTYMSHLMNMKHAEPSHLDFGFTTHGIVVREVLWAPETGFKKGDLIRWFSHAEEGDTVLRDLPGRIFLHLWSVHRFIVLVHRVFVIKPR